MKHTFYETGLTLIDGELVETDPKEVEYNFSLKMSGLKLFEQEYGKPLIKVITKLSQEIGSAGETFSQAELLGIVSNFDEKAIKALACASYIKIANNQLINNESTVEEFKESFAYGILMNDIEFVLDLITMAINQTFEKKKSNAGNGKAKN